MWLIINVIQDLCFYVKYSKLSWNDLDKFLSKEVMMSLNKLRQIAAQALGM